MLPIVDRPTIQYIVEEAVSSGIEEILIISGRNKRMIEDHFDKSFELEEMLIQKNNQSLLAEVQKISALANIHYIRQKEPRGLGDAIYCAKSFIGDEPFAILLGDDIIKSDKPCLQQLIEVFDRFQTSVVGVQKVPVEHVSNYGIIKPKGNDIEENTINVQSLVEKPSASEAPSNYAIMGRYVLRPEIFNILRDLSPDKGGEVQLTDAINQLNQTQAVLAYEFQGIRYDIGNKLGFLKATIDMALQRPEFRSDILSYMKKIIASEEQRRKGE